MTELRLFGVILIAATPAAAADQFDLVCKGRSHRAPLAAWKPYEVRYRIDLGRGIYCAQECSNVRPLGAVNAARIDLDPPSDATARLRTEHWVDRTSGRLTQYISGMIEVEAACERAPFTPLPAAKL